MSLQAPSGEWLRWLGAPDLCFFMFLDVFCCLFLHCLFDVLELSVLFVVMGICFSYCFDVLELTVLLLVITCLV